MKRDDIIEYSLYNHHSEEEGVKKRKEIWVVKNTWDKQCTGSRKVYLPDLGAYRVVFRRKNLTNGQKSYPNGQKNVVGPLFLSVRPILGG